MAKRKKPGEMKDPAEEVENDEVLKDAQGSQEGGGMSGQSEGSNQGGGKGSRG
jgi:hypothetical protein